jgi:myosin heavy subunit
MVRWMQGEIRGKYRRKDYQKRHDRIHLMKVIQRNFRKYFELRNWGWFIIVQKTKPLIGQENLEDQLKQLEERCNQSYGKYKEQLDTKVIIFFYTIDFEIFFVLYFDMLF